MNTSDIVEHLAASHSLTRSAAKTMVDTIFAAISDAAMRGDEIALGGFGKFKVKDSPAREGRNPSTGEPMTIAATRKLTFSSAKALKDMLHLASK